MCYAVWLDSHCKTPSASKWMWSVLSRPDSTKSKPEKDILALRCLGRVWIHIAKRPQHQSGCGGPYFPGQIPTNQSPRKTVLPWAMSVLSVMGRSFSNCKTPSASKWMWRSVLSRPDSHNSKPEKDSPAMRDVSVGRVWIHIAKRPQHQSGCGCPYFFGQMIKNQSLRKTVLPWTM